MSDLQPGEKAAVRFGIGDVNKDGKVDVNARVVVAWPLFGEHVITLGPKNVPVEEALAAAASMGGGLASLVAGMASGNIPLPPLPRLPGK